MDTLFLMLIVFRHVAVKHEVLKPSEMVALKWLADFVRLMKLSSYIFV